MGFSKDITNRTKDRTNKDVAAASVGGSMVGASASAWGGLLLLLVLPPGVQALTDTSTYAASTGDLFPDDPDVDVAVDVSGTVHWRLDAPPLLPGEASDALLQPRPGNLDIAVRYKLPRACCERQFVEGARVVHGFVPLASTELPSLDVDGWQLVFHVGGSLQARPRAFGPATVEARGLTWADWDPGRVRIATDASARPADDPELRVATDLGARLVLHATDGAGASRESGASELLLPAASELAYPLQVEPARAVPDAWPWAALVVAFALARRR